MVQAVQPVVRQDRPGAVREGWDDHDRALVPVQEPELRAIEGPQVRVAGPRVGARAEVAGLPERHLEPQDAADEVAVALGRDPLAREHGQALNVGRAAVVAPLAVLPVPGDGHPLGPLRVGCAEVVRGFADALQLPRLLGVDLVDGEALRELRAFRRLRRPLQVVLRRRRLLRGGLQRALAPAEVLHHSDGLIEQAVNLLHLLALAPARRLLLEARRPPAVSAAHVLVQPPLIPVP
mmetsp:Transcript_61522/g.146507  ORF Transcript_61522/g.146507 Transcript_61522/m.146507 type:complete len:236 (-) Transcript_61522:220-927(-)